MEGKMICPKCNKEVLVQNNTKFCRFCGCNFIQNPPMPIGGIPISEAPIQSTPIEPIPVVPVQSTPVTPVQSEPVISPTIPVQPEPAVPLMPAQDPDATVILEQPFVQGNSVQDSDATVILEQPFVQESFVQDPDATVILEQSPNVPFIPGQQAVPAQQVAPQPPVPPQKPGKKPPKQKAPKQKPPKQKKSGALTAVIVALIILLILLIIGAVTILAKMGIIDISGVTDKIPFLNSEEKVEEMTGEGDGEGDISAEEASAEELLAQADALVSENKENVFNDQLRMDALLELENAVNIYIQAGEGDEEAAEAGIKETLSVYEKGIQQQVDMLKGVDVSADIYKEMVSILDDALALGQKAVDAGYDVSMPGVQAQRDKIEDDYKKLYIDKFNEFSEAYEWNVRANEEFARGAKEVFPSDDPDDPIRLRYAYAYAWLVHQEVIAEGVGSGNMSAEEAVEQILAALPEADYCEFLIEEAETLALNSSKPNMNYFKSVKAPVIADSSTKEYSASEIASLGLSPAQLRLARMEIYARHGMKTYDAGIDKELGGSANIDMYKFMSYNDFNSAYSTDGMNGLTVTERHNIRVIAQLEIDSRGNGYFMMK